jgi:hypothetical protein
MVTVCFEDGKAAKRGTSQKTCLGMSVVVLGIEGAPTAVVLHTGCLA